MGTSRRRTSLNKYCPPHDRSRPVVSRIAANDRRHMAERIRRRSFCDPPAARRIGGVDFRAQGCVERRFLHAYARRLRALCQVSLPPPLPGDVDLVRARSHVQADAGDCAVPSIAA